MSAENWLRNLSDRELRAVAAELEDRAEQFDSKVRAQVNDELRRRRMPTVQGKRW